MFKVRIHEINSVLKRNPGNTKLREHYDGIKKSLPVLLEFERASLKTKIIYALVMLRRRIRRML